MLAEEGDLAIRLDALLRQQGGGQGGGYGGSGGDGGETMMPDDMGETFLLEGGGGGGGGGGGERGGGGELIRELSAWTDEDEVLLAEALGLSVLPREIQTESPADSTKAGLDQAASTSTVRDFQSVVMTGFNAEQGEHATSLSRALGAVREGEDSGVMQAATSHQPPASAKRHNTSISPKSSKPVTQGIVDAAKGHEIDVEEVVEGSKSGLLDVREMSWVRGTLSWHALASPPRCFASSPNLLAIGSTRGIISALDTSTHTLAYAMEHPSGAPVPVTALCFSPRADLLVCGFLSGSLIIADGAKGGALRSIEGVHVHPISRVVFVSFAGFVVADSAGKVTMSEVHKALLTHRVQTNIVVQDASALGQILDIAAAPPPLRDVSLASGGASTEDQRGGGEGVLVAMSTSEMMFVARLGGERVKIAVNHGPHTRNRSHELFNPENQI